MSSLLANALLYNSRLFDEKLYVMKSIPIHFNKFLVLPAIVFSSLYALFGLVSIVLSICQMLGLAPEEELPPPAMLLFGSVFLGLSTWLTAVLTKCLKGQINALQINEIGIYDNANWPYSLGQVYWREIKVVRTKGWWIVKYVEIELYQPKLVIQRQKGILKRFFLSSTLIFRASPFVIKPMMLNMSFAKLEKLLNSIDTQDPTFNHFYEHLVE